MVDNLLDYLQGLDELPVWQPAQDQVKAHINQALTLERYQSAGRVSPWICAEAINMKGEAVA